jgi:hypothetical protein
LLSAEHSEIQVSKDIIRLGGHKLRPNRPPVEATNSDPFISLVTAPDRTSITLKCGDSRIVSDKGAIVLQSGNFALGISKDGGIQLGTKSGNAFADNKPLIAFKDQALAISSPSTVELNAGQKKATWVSAGRLQLDGFMKFERGSITGNPNVMMNGQGLPLPAHSNIDLAALFQARRQLIAGDDDDEEPEEDDDDWLE